MLDSHKHVSGATAATMLDSITSAGQASVDAHVHQHNRHVVTAPWLTVNKPVYPMQALTLKL